MLGGLLAGLLILGVNLLWHRHNDQKYKNLLVREMIGINFPLILTVYSYIRQSSGQATKESAASIHEDIMQKLSNDIVSTPLMIESIVNANGYGQFLLLQATTNANMGPHDLMGALNSIAGKYRASFFNFGDYGFRIKLEHLAMRLSLLIRNLSLHQQADNLAQMAQNHGLEINISPQQAPIYRARFKILEEGLKNYLKDYRDFLNKYSKFIKLLD